MRRRHRHSQCGRPSPCISVHLSEEERLSTPRARSFALSFVRAQWKLAFNEGGVGTFLPLFFRLLTEMRAMLSQQQSGTIPTATAIPVATASEMLQVRTGAPCRGQLRHNHIFKPLV
mmetsp:Transcript_9356/g.20477  ORF Transcript_9356/g.20477 Transcript_9356/m.20477 type:complete len:117 (+) Transcript_9356:1070-1420(+)